MSLFPFDPDAHLARLVARFDMDNARPAADGTILGVGLVLTTAQIDGKLIRLATEGALHESRRALAIGHDLPSMGARRRKATGKGKGYARGHARPCAALGVV